MICKNLCRALATRPSLNSLITWGGSGQGRSGQDDEVCNLENTEEVSVRISYEIVQEVVGETGHDVDWEARLVDGGSQNDQEHQNIMKKTFK